jgi:hypothetical protein
MITVLAKRNGADHIDAQASACTAASNQPCPSACAAHGAFALFGLVIVWALLAMAVAQFPIIKANAVVEALYYVVAGLAWVLPGHARCAGWRWIADAMPHRRGESRWPPAVGGARQQDLHVAHCWCSPLSEMRGSAIMRTVCPTGRPAASSRRFEAEACGDGNSRGPAAVLSPIG